jgi:hypothetical protein
METKSFRIAVHTGPLSSENGDLLVHKLREAGALDVVAGTERVYFRVTGIGDAVDAHLAGQALLRRAFGKGTCFQPVVTNTL